MSGYVYLIHFDQPIGSGVRGQAQHYLGWCKVLKKRMAAHKAGNGARIMAVLHERGIGWKCVRTWSGNRGLERRLKNYHKARQLCPVCREARKNGHNTTE